jgi:hypothetical protein
MKQYVHAADGTIIDVKRRDESGKIVVDSYDFDNVQQMTWEESRINADSYGQYDLVPPSSRD